MDNHYNNLGLTIGDVMHFRNKDEMDMYNETVKNLDKMQKKITHFMNTNEEAKKMVRDAKRAIEQKEKKAITKKISPLLERFKQMQNK